VTVTVALGLLGLRLVWLAGRTGELPELLLGLFFVSIGPLGFLPVFLIEFWPDARPDYVLMARAIGATGRLLGVALLCVFTWRVFRADAAWAAVLTAGVMLSLMVGYAYSALVESFGPAAPSSPLWHLRMGTRSVVVAWCAFEPLRFTFKARRRVALGLMSPLVANRLLLWTVWAGSCLVVQVAGYAVAYGWLEAGPAGFIRALSAAGGGFAIWLTFFPPAGYRRLFEPSPPRPGSAPF
jgi:hypothetical protein